MKRKPIRIDWDALEAAFESRGEDLPYYLDLVTGHVALEGQGERDEDEDEEDGEAGADPLRLYVEPPDREEELGWMRGFLDRDGVLDDALRARLAGALASDDPFAAFRNVLRDEPDARDRWFAFKSDRIHESIQEWLERNGVPVAGDPPWV